MLRLSIDGSHHTGNYQCECECGARWHGQGEPINAYTWSPALPVAECVAHIRGEHPRSVLDLSFTDRFSRWLMAYWEQANARIAARPHRATFVAQIRMPT